MDIITFITNTAAILELVFFILTMFYLINGLRTKDYKNLKVYGCIYFLLNFSRRISEFIEKRGAAVSVIGGADGPTSIFIAGKVGSSFQIVTFLLGLFVVLLVVGIIYFIKKKK